ncbi:MAG: hypothetical protein F6K10_41130, partial [Moorea sp. SIO2B7]|nr:hypothetical protein [Moorena sp. SIO2B7]
MFPNAQGIPGLPDLTHPNELIQFGKELLTSFLTLTLIVAALGIIIALISFSLRRNESDRTNFIQEWVINYLILLRGFQHGILVVLLLVIGFFFCSTLANRYHNWEQARIAKIAEGVAGSRLEQIAPRIRYLVEKPYSYNRIVNGKLIRVEETRTINRYLALNSSDIQVKIDQTRNRQDNRNNYLIDFAAVYEVTNSLPESKELFFEISPPYGYSLLKNFRVEKEQKRLEPINPGNYSFLLPLEPGQSSSFRVAYQAQGGPRWIYNAGSELLANFRLAVKANFPNADFASGIA